MTERQKYLWLLSIVIEELPTSAVAAAVRAGCPALMLSNVRIGRVENAVRALPSRICAVIDSNQGDTLALEQELNDVQQDRNSGGIR